MQVIHIGYFDNPQQVFEKFDFTVCMGAFDFLTEEFVLHPSFLRHNAQRILVFNGNTSFPYVSALRVDKYTKKGYKISKPEFIKVLLACAGKEIKTYSELKEQIGGMYGNNVDKLFDEKEDFSLSKAIEQLSKVDVNNSDFNTPQLIHFDNEDDLLDNIINHSKQWFEFKGNKYSIKCSGRLNPTDTVPNDSKQVAAEDYLVGLSIYKNVRKKDDRYFSFYRSEFEYELGETVVAKKDGYNNGILYCQTNMTKLPYSFYDDSVIIELKIEDINDIVHVYNNDIQVSKAKFVRVVSE